MMAIFSNHFFQKGSDKYEYHKGDSRVLTITDVTFADRDLFTCKSTHQNVTSTLAIRLRVRGKFYFPES